MFCIALAVLKQLSLNLILIILIITTVLVGGVLPLIERKFLSLIQRRVGPNIVGYRGRLQFLADALKLFLKEVITIQSANRRAAFLLPTVFLVTNLLILFFLVWDRSGAAVVQIEYSTPAFLILFAVCAFITANVGLVIKNKYTQLSSSRIIHMAINFDIVITALLILLLLTYNHFSFLEAIKTQHDYVGLVFLVPASLTLLIMYLMDVGRAPFDLVESESELIMGFHSEYSSFLFALFILGEYIHIYLFSYFLSTVLLYIN